MQAPKIAIKIKDLMQQEMTLHECFHFNEELLNKVASLNTKQVA